MAGLLLHDEKKSITEKYTMLFLLKHTGIPGLMRGQRQEMYHGDF